MSVHDAAEKNLAISSSMCCVNDEKPVSTAPVEMAEHASVRQHRMIGGRGQVLQAIDSFPQKWEGLMNCVYKLCTVYCIVWCNHVEVCAPNTLHHCFTFLKMVIESHDIFSLTAVAVKTLQLSMHTSQ